MFLLSSALAFVCPLLAEQPLPQQLEGVGIDEKVGQDIDLNLTFTNGKGYQQPLRDFFHPGKPVILNLVYYTCPMLCNLVMNGQTQAMREIPWTPGDQYEVVTISINPTETFDLAQKKRIAYTTSYDRPAPGWHFLVDHDGNVKKLAAQMGFHYRWDEQQQQYAHAAAIMILTPTGKISRYLYGIKFKPRDLRLALTEASDNKFAFSVDRLLLYCFHYDPAARGYVMFATNFMRAGGVLCVLLIGFFVYRMLRAERLRQQILQ